MDKYKIIALLLTISAIFSAGSWWGYSGEHDLRIADKAAADAVAANQAEKIKALNKELKENADEAGKNIAIATGSIADWYRDHPVIRVLHGPGGSCEGTGSDGNPGVADGSATSLYVSPHNPEQVEVVAARLNELQRLLRQNQVCVKALPTDKKCMR